MSKNNLISLVGEYMSDSDTENESDRIVKQKENTNIELPTTSWTKCIDLNSGHPYYWNVDTKEVTWETPPEYDHYIEQIINFNKQIPIDCWVVGNSDDKSKYYVNQYTREISWTKPENFKDTTTNELNKEKIIKTKDTSLNNKKKKSQKIKKSVVPRSQSTSDDEKIELITSYKANSDISSDEEANQQKILQDNNEKEKEKVKCGVRKIVAAYSTDESDIDDITIKNSSYTNTNIENSSNNTKNQCHKESSSNIQTNLFSSIITGGVIENPIPEEITKLKIELEKLKDTEKEENIIQDDTENFDGKTFQRKRRIEFKKTGNKQDNNKYQPDINNSNDNQIKPFEYPDKDKNNLYSNFQRGHIEFANNNKEIENIQNKDAENSSDIKPIQTEIEDLSDVIAGKIKFLSVGHADVSAVQTMKIQLDTLLTAFHASSLDPEYFFVWLKCNSDELLSLEQNAVPNGWKCIWDRENSQYCYKNLITEDVQWEFPVEKNENESKGVTSLTTDKQNKDDNGILRGEDEMDISTTPPHNIDDEIIGQNDISWNDKNPPSSQLISTSTPPPLNVDLNCELASFYSDLAALEATSSHNISDNNETQIVSTSNDTLKDKKPIQIDVQSIKKKRKKVKVQGLGVRMKEVSTMVANWRKAQKELDN